MKAQKSEQIIEMFLNGSLTPFLLEPLGYTAA